MNTNHIARLFGTAAVATSGLAATVLAAPVLPTAAADCPDVEVVFARGTGEAPGPGPTGQVWFPRDRGGFLKPLAASGWFP